MVSSCVGSGDNGDDESDDAFGMHGGEKHHFAVCGRVNVKWCVDLAQSPAYVGKNTVRPRWVVTALLVVGSMARPVSEYHVG